MNLSREPQPSMVFVKLWRASDGVAEVPTGSQSGPRGGAMYIPYIVSALMSGWEVLYSRNMKPDWVTLEGLSKTFTKYKILLCQAPADGMFDTEFEL